MKNLLMLAVLCCVVLYGASTALPYPDPPYLGCKMEAPGYMVCASDIAPSPPPCRENDAAKMAAGELALVR
jgi:hypothetical protein